MPSHSSNYYGTSLLSLLPPANRTASANSGSFDITNYDSATFAVEVGQTGDTFSGTNRVEASLQESDDNTNWTPVSDNNVTNPVAGQNTGTFMVLTANSQAGSASAAVIYKAGYIGSKRYARVALTNYGTTATGTPMSVIAVGGRPRYAPAA